MANLNLSKTAAQSSSVLATGEWEVNGTIVFVAEGLLDFDLDEIFVQGRDFIINFKTFKCDKELVTVQFAADFNMKSIGEDPTAFVTDYSDKIERAFHPALLAHLEKVKLDEKIVKTVMLRIDVSGYPSHCENGLGFLETCLERVAGKNDVEVKRHVDLHTNVYSYEIIA